MNSLVLLAFDMGACFIGWHIDLFIRFVGHSSVLILCYFLLSAMLIDLRLSHFLWIL